MKKQLLILMGMLCFVGFISAQTTFADYETINPTFYGWDGSTFNIVTNPDQTGNNTSANCAQTNTSDQGWGWAGLYTDPLGGKIDFTSGTVFTMNVKAPFECNVLFKLEGSGGAASEVTVAVDPAYVGVWATMSFDFTAVDHANDTYNKIVLIFDAGGYTTSDQWFFDDIEGPGFTASTGEQVTFTVSDYFGLTSALVKVYDNGGSSTTYTLYDDGTNGDPTSGDLAFTAVATDLTGRVYSDASGVGEYSWEVVNGGTIVSDQKDFTLMAGDQKTQSLALYPSGLNNDTIFCKPTATAPTIDGAIDAMWAGYTAIPVTKTVWGSFSNPADMTVTVKTAFDNSNVYFLAEITDDVLTVNNGNAWEKDNIELYFDIDNNDSYDGGIEGQKRWIWSDGNAGSPGTQAQITAGDSKSWIVEIAIPFSEFSSTFFPSDSLDIGFDITNGDNDSDHREGILSWHADDDQAYANASKLGELLFVNIARLSIAYDGDITEGAEDGEVITITVENDEFVSSIVPSNYTLSSNLPTGVSVGSITRTSATTVEITLSGNATEDYDTDIELTLAVDAAEFVNYSIIDIPAKAAATLSATVEALDNARLSDLLVGGTSIPGFLPTTYNYTYELANSVTTPPAITGVADAAGASVGAEVSASSVPGTSTLTVTAENGTTTLTYSVHFVHPDPDVAANVPPARLNAEVISIFSGAYTNLSNTNFNPSWGSGTYSEVDIAGNASIKYANLNWQGILPENPINASSMEFLHFDFWSSTAATIKVVFNNSVDSVIAVTKYQWMSCDIPASKFASVASAINEIKFEASNKTVYLDNIYFYKTIPAGTDAYLSDIKVGGVSIDNFTEHTLSYLHPLVLGTTTVPAVTATTEDANATAAITPATSIPGTTTILVTAEDGTTTKTYTVLFQTEAPTPLARSASSVISIFSDAFTNVAGTNFNPGWGQATKCSTVDFAGNATLKYANLNFQGTEFGSDQDVSGFDYLHVDMLTYDASEVKVFCISRGSGEKSVSLTPISAGQWGSFDIPLSDYTDQGLSINDLFQFKITGTGGSTIYLDNLYFYKTNSDATLSDIKVSGTSITGFVSGTLNYTIELAYGTTTVPAVTATTTFANASALVTAATQLPGTTSILVTAENGTTTKTYTVAFTLAASNDATLSDLTVDGTTVTDFAAETLAYTVEIPYGTETVPTIIATPNDAAASVDITNPTSLPGSASIVVTAANGTSTKTYTISFIYGDPSNDASLSAIKVNGVSITSFTAATLNYSYELPYGTVTVPDVTATSTESHATVVITAAPSIPGSTTLVVTAQDGTTSQTYSVSFTLAAPSTDATLSDLLIDDLTLLDFNSDTLNYQIELPYGTTIVPVVTAETTHDSATVIITQAATVTDTAIVEVTAQDGLTKITYTIAFSVADFISSDATLRDIKVNGTSIANFSSGIYAYRVMLPFGTTEVPTVVGVKKNTAASVEVINAITLTDTTKIVVTAQDTVTQLTYTISFTIADPTYNVTFNIFDASDNALADAQVVFLADTLVTTIDGSVVFTSVSPTTEAAYKVSKQGYVDFNGSLSVVDADVTEKVNLALQTYSVTFKAFDADSVLITGAKVIFQNDTILTDTLGLAKFDSIAPVTNAKFTVTKAGYINGGGTVTVVDKDITKEVKLTLKTYNVTFNVIDVDQNKLGGVQVIFQNDTIVTDTSGSVKFAGIAPVTEANYIVSKDSYVSVNGTLSVVDADVNITINLSLVTYSVRFTVLDDEDNALANAQVIFMSDTLLTDNSGKAIFTEIAPVNDAAYIVSNDNYVSAGGTLSVIDADVNITINLSLVAYTVQFTVLDDEDNALANAQVIFMSDTLLTNIDGKVIFTEIAQVVDAVYIVSKDGYDAMEGSVSIINTDVELSVKLMRVGVISKLSSISNIYPNPTKGELHIQFNKITEGAFMDIFDANGRIVERIEITALETIIDMQDRGNGIYFIRLLTNNHQYMGRFVLSK